MGAYDNSQIDNVLSQIDVLVVPSIWYENAPLVIQEAFMAGIPVVTSNIGGMAELVRDEDNGFLFEVGNIESLSEVMNRISKCPSILNTLRVSASRVRSIEDDASHIIRVYRRLLQ